MISNTYNRYLWLLNTLLQYKRLTFDEIRNKWEASYMSEGKTLSLRTFHMHRHAVEEMFQVSVECDISDGYKYYIEDADSIAEDRARKWLLNSFNVSNMVSEGKMLKDRILLEDIPQGTEYLSDIIEAMRNNWVLEVDYKPFYEDKSKIYHVEPYCMKVFQHRWYVLGKFRELNGLRHFSLDRVNGIVQTKETFVYPEDFSPEDYYKNVIGIWTNEKYKPVDVVIRAYGLQSKYLRTLPLHETQEEINTTGEYVDFRYKLCVTNDLVRELLAKGADVEVLEPYYLKKKLINAAFEILKKYKK